MSGQHFVAQRTCQRKGCSGDLTGYRSDARYCSEACSKAAKRAASADKGRTRRKSRDGSGTRVYLTAEEIEFLSALPRQKRHRGSSIAGRIMLKLDRANRRVKS